MFGFMSSRNTLRGAVILSALAFLPCAMPAQAQDNEMRALSDKVDKLDGQMRSITKYLSKNSNLPKDLAESAGDLPPDQAASYEVRLSDFDTQLRTITGQLEEVRHEVQQVSDRLDRLSQDYEYRLEQLEGKNPGAQASGSQANAAGGALPPGAPATPGTAPQNGAAAQQTANIDQTLPADDPAAMYNSALGRLRQENYKDAADAFQSFLTKYPDSELAANAQYWLGEAYYAQQDYTGAARAFLVAYQKYPKSNKASGALLKLGISLGELNQKQDACAALREFGQKYPNASPVESSRAAKAKQDLNCS